MLVVIDDDPPLRQAARHDVTRGVDRARGCQDRIARQIPGPEAIAPPCGTGGNRNMFCPGFQNLISGHRALAEYLNIIHLVDLPDAIIADPRPLVQPRQTGLGSDPSAQRPSCLGQHHPVTAFAQRMRRLQLRWPGTYDKHAGVRTSWADPFGMPATRPLFGYGGILRAAYRHALGISGVADVAADAFADVLEPALADLLRQERIGDGRARGADEIQNAAPDLAGHRIGRGKAPDRNNGLGCQRFDPGDIRLERSLGHETRQPHFERVVFDIDIPEIGQLAQHTKNLFGLTGYRIAVAARSTIDFGGHPYGDCHVSPTASRVSSMISRTQPHPVSELTAIIVITPVDGFGHELRQQIAMCRVDIDQIKTGGSGPERGVAMPAARVTDILQVHLARLKGISGQIGQAAHRQRNLAGAQIGHARAAQAQFDTRQCPMCMHLVGHQGMRPDIALIPERRTWIGQIIG